jgi:hypothetical protein
MNNLKGLLDWAIQIMKCKAKRVNELIWVVYSLSRDGVMKLKIELVGKMDDLVNDSFYGQGEMDHLVECECLRGKFNRDQER